MDLKWKLPKIIQGGMGIAVSSWQLARAVSQEGQLGVVSGTSMNSVLIRRLQDGDEGGHMRRAMRAFPFPDVAEKMEKMYYIEGGKAPGASYRRSPMFSIDPPRLLQELTVIANFCEVWLAKEGHEGQVGVNLLTKVELPNVFSLYGAMLAGVDCVIMGAGIPREIPGVLDKLARNEDTSMRVTVEGASCNDDYRVRFSPREIFGDQLPELKRPRFLPIISSNTLAIAMLKKATGRIDGFVVEEPTAGGHNAPPRGEIAYNDKGEPVYTERDKVDLDKLRKLGLPFWLAGGWTGANRLREALARGAAGVQLGTIFACCKESGLAAHLRKQILESVIKGTIRVFTDPKASPTGFPFKVVRLEDTASEENVYQERPRCCDLGYLRSMFRKEDGSVGYACKSEPLDTFRRKKGHTNDTEGRKCLCNALMANIGQPQVQKDGTVEPPLVTAGDELMSLAKYLDFGQWEYSARDVVRWIIGELEKEWQDPEMVAANS